MLRRTAEALAEAGQVGYSGVGGAYGVPRRMSARFMAKAERATTEPMPAARAASIVAVSTCDTKPSVGMEASDASPFIAASVPIGSVRGLLRSKMTSDGASARI